MPEIVRFVRRGATFYSKTPVEVIRNSVYWDLLEPLRGCAITDAHVCNYGSLPRHVGKITDQEEKVYHYKRELDAKNPNTIEMTKNI